MGDNVIRIRCPGCGKFVRVSSSLGGRRVKCPGCAEALTVPEQNDSRDGEIVTDEMLPEVARDVEELEKVFGETSVAPPPAAPPPAAPARDRSTPRLPRRPFGETRVRPRPTKTAGNPLVWIIPVSIVVVAVIVVVVMAVSPTPPTGVSSRVDSSIAPPVDSRKAVEVDPELEARCREYFKVFNRGELQEILKFHAYTPSEEMVLKGALSARLEQGVRYEIPVFKSATLQGDGCVLVVEYGLAGSTRSEATMRWKRAEGGWKINGLP